MKLQTLLRLSLCLIFSVFSLLPAGLLLAPDLALASGGGHNEHIREAPINDKDLISKQRGAKLFVNYCSGCHSLKYLRYERMATDLKIPSDIVEENLMFAGGKIGDQIRIAMSSKDAAHWFGAPPPDLTLEARLRGTDWLYSYLTSFYPDEKRPWGVNNHVFPEVGMPHVLEKFEAEVGAEAFRSAMADLTNFLAYAAEPIKLERQRLGAFVLLFLAIFAVPAYFLGKEYWKDVK